MMPLQTIERDPVYTVLKWVLLITAIACFIALGIGTYRTYQGAPPIPSTFLSPDQQVLFTDQDLFAGKEGFQRADLMDFGSLYGMGSYYGDDYTAKYLVELGQNVQTQLAQSLFHTSFDSLNPDQQLFAQRHMQHMLQQIDLTQPQVQLTEPLSNAVQKLQQEISNDLLNNNFAAGWTKAYSLTPESAKQVADFLIYSSMTTVAHRPGLNYSYTNNWPYEPSVGNTPTSNTFLWTWISFCFVFLGFGVVLYIYHHYLNGPDQSPKTPLFSSFNPLTESQIKIGKYFFIVSLVLLLQIGVGSLMAHDYADRNSFYGININAWLPFAFLRDVHIQSPIIWIGLSWISAALFLAPLISGQEAKGQKYWIDLLFWVTLLIVAGAILGDYLGIMGVLNNNHVWFWIGNQGLSYIELGRLWQLGFFVGLILWSIMVFRGLWPTAQQLFTATKEFWTGNIRLEHLFWASTINIAVLYWFGMIPLTGIEKSFTITDFWRWWVVHLWVEQSFEFFTVCVSAYLLMAVGLISRQLAERTVLFETILIFLGGVLGTGHHWYWIGTPDMWLALGSVFSFIEVLPLMMLIIEAIEQHRLIKHQTVFHYRLAYLYVIGAAVWNFVGAGVFGGGTINAPLINYYEHATFLTLNHAHTALFGAFGLLALGMIYFCLRYAAGNGKWSDRLGIWAFWLYNLGLLLWIVLNFFPVGWAQLVAVYEHGFSYARSSAFYNTTLLWQWLRFPGDVIFAAGALVMAWDFIVKLKPFFRGKPL